MMHTQFWHRWTAGAWAVLCSTAIASGIASVPLRAQAPVNGPSYTTGGNLVFPKAYRKWVFLSSGLDMAYLPSARPGQSTFTNVFVNPESYDAFLQTGTWPNKTTLVLEVRTAADSGSIIRGGHYQSDVAHTEVHVKDTARFKGGWAFFGFADEAPAQMIPRNATCYSCHQDHGAVDTTFVQFYPTLLPIARDKKTFGAGYLADETKATQQH